MVIGYARVSTDDQTNVAQLAELKKADCKRIYEEKLSGRNVDRPELSYNPQYSHSKSCEYLLF
jgi:DNA invertase Pin-like site-specific DNA recombinase